MLKSFQKNKIAFLIVFAMLAGGCETTNSTKSSGGVSNSSPNSYTRANLTKSSDPRSAEQSSYDKGDLNDLADDIKDRLKNLPNDEVLRLSLAGVYIMQRRLNEAEVHVRSVLKQNYKNDAAKFMLANIAYARGKNSLAAHLINNLGGLNSTYPGALNLLALIELRKNDAQTATAILERAVNRNPKEIASRMNLGLLYLRHMEFNKAEKQFQDILKMESNNKDAISHLATTQAIKGNLSRAEQLYSSIGSTRRNNPVLVFNEAVLQKRQKDFDGAISTLKDYLDDFPPKLTGYQAFQLIKDIRHHLTLQSIENTNEVDDLLSELASHKEATDESYIFNAPTLPSR